MMRPFLPSSRRPAVLLLPFVLLAAVLVVAPVPATAAIGDVRTAVIPALREWSPGTGTFTYGQASRVVVASAHASALGSDAATFADDLSALTGRRPAVVVGSPVAGDVSLTLGSSETALGDQGYRMTVGSALTITGRTTTGVFYGTRSVLQLLRQDRVIPAGTARDWPAYGERGALVDTKPRHFSLTWYRNWIRDLAYVKLNDLTVLQPLKDASDAEIAEIAAFAAKYHVNLMPVLGMPAHTKESILATHPEYALHPGGPAPADGAFDFTKPGALAIAKQFIDERIVKFAGRYWHTGADEFIAYPNAAPNWDRYPQLAQFARERTGNPSATGRDAYVWFLNWVNGIVKSHGKITRVWNDHLESGGVLRLDRDIVVEHWVQPDNPRAITPQQFADSGHRVYNFNNEYLYYDNGVRRLNPAAVYEEFTVDHFAGDDQYVTGPALANVLGARFAIWNDPRDPDTPVESNAEMAENLYAPLRSLAQVVWGTPKIGASYAAFAPAIDRVGRAPGWQRFGDVVGDPVVIADADGRMTYYVRTESGAVVHGWQGVPGGDWEGNQTTVATGIAGQPNAVLDGLDRPGFFARTSANRLVYVRQRAPGTWDTATVLTEIAGNPASILDGAGRLNVFVRRADGTLAVAWQEAPGGDVWRTGTAATGVVDSPVVVRDGNDRVVFFSRTASGALIAGVQDGTSWRVSTVASGVTGRPAVILGVNRLLYFFVRGSDSTLRHGWQASVGGAWASPVSLGSGISGNPATVADADGRVTYFVRATDGTLRHGWQADPGQGPWLSEALGGGYVGDPAVTLDSTGRLMFFVRGTGNTLHRGWHDVPGGDWLTGQVWDNVVGTPAALRDVSGGQTYFATATYGYLLHGYEKDATDPGGVWLRTVLVGTIES
jgi:hexosaminidase